ncbi:MAG: murein hydrolase activator EnvC family protein [Cellulosilyticaceae bacterium]
MKRRYIALLLAGLMIGQIPLSASSLSNKKEELSNTKENIKNAQSELKQAEAEKKQAQAEIEKLDGEIIKVEDEVMALETQLGEKEAQISQVKVELEGAIEKKDYQYEATKKRMVQMYKNSKGDYMKLVFSSGSLSELLSRTQYIKVISEYDNQLLDEYKAQEQIIAEHQQVLEKEEEALQTIHTKQVAIRDDLESKRKEKNKRVGILEQKSTSLHAQIDDFEEASKALEKEIARLTQNSTLKYNGGKFGWPVPGHYRLSSDYNPRNHPIFNTNEFHQGIDIPAPYGKAVVAAADGVVITSGNVRGFGKTIIIDHGSGLTTIYGHNSSLTASVGQKVTKGQQVAKIGSTGYSTGNHCHFEVRINNKHTNPWNYLSK